jgi:hypothetical protein
MDTLAQLEELRLTIGILALVMLAVVMMATARNAEGVTTHPRLGRTGAGFDDADDGLLDVSIPERSGHGGRPGSAPAPAGTEHRLA